MSAECLYWAGDISQLPLPNCRYGKQSWKANSALNCNARECYSLFAGSQQLQLSQILWEKKQISLKQKNEPRAEELLQPLTSAAKPV